MKSYGVWCFTTAFGIDFRIGEATDTRGLRHGSEYLGKIKAESKEKATQKLLGALASSVLKLLAKPISPDRWGERRENATAFSERRRVHAYRKSECGAAPGLPEGHPLPGRQEQNN